ESHLKMIGLMEDHSLDEHQRALVDEKRKEYDSLQNGGVAEYNGDYPEGAQMCNKCMTKAAVLMDGCMTCLSCGDSKCG
ncbi:MAG: hypothetical protein OQJ89_08745, partial [Kangiellaceae bacterium]|nr:hypothetical protein [Kangiellaceae bacterium]